MGGGGKETIESNGNNLTANGGRPGGQGWGRIRGRGEYGEEEEGGRMMRRRIGSGNMMAGKGNVNDPEREENRRKIPINHPPRRAALPPQLRARVTTVWSSSDCRVLVLFPL